MAFVFYHKFMWLKSRLQQSERERQTLEEDNRLFKQDFGDKINSLQLEVEQLSKQRGQLELELKRERDQGSHFHHRIQENRSLHSQNRSFRKEAGNKFLEGDAKQKIPVQDEKSKIAHSLQEEHEQPNLGKSELCQLCQEESTRSKRKNICKNCSGVFCEDCSANELPLPSSIYPECVCNQCHKHLIQQYSASPS